jgi:hypothetical protein
VEGNGCSSGKLPSEVMERVLLVLPISTMLLRA